MAWFGTYVIFSVLFLLSKHLLLSLSHAYLSFHCLHYVELLIVWVVYRILNRWLFDLMSFLVSNIYSSYCEIITTPSCSDGLDFEIIIQEYYLPIKIVMKRDDIEGAEPQNPKKLITSKSNRSNVSGMPLTEYQNIYNFLLKWQYL